MAERPSWALADTTAPSGRDFRPLQPRAAGRFERSRAAAATPEVESSARLLSLDEGLYTLSFDRTESRPDPELGVDLPAVLVSAPPASDYDPVEIVVSSGDTGAWIDAQGGTVVVKSPPGGGIVLLTTFGAQSPAQFEPEVRRLSVPAAGRPAGAVLAAEPPVVAPPPLPADRGVEVSSEVLLHIEQEGDRRFVTGGWLGNRGRRLRIEGFSVRPLDQIPPDQIEYKAFAPNGRETPWVSNGRLCGTRGRGLPLTGLAIRLAPQLQRQFDVVYEASFFDGGLAGPSRNGEPCRSSVVNDPLEAINVRIIRRGGI